MKKVFVTLLIFVAGAAASTAQAGKTAKISLTGCVDELNGEYVLTNDTDLHPTARLRPVAGSPEDNFARHVGEKVTVRGTLSDDKPLPVVTVENLQTISQSCGPAPGEQPK